MTAKRRRLWRVNSHSAIKGSTRKSFPRSPAAREPIHWRAIMGFHARNHVKEFSHRGTEAQRYRADTNRREQRQQRGYICLCFLCCLFSNSFFSLPPCLCVKSLIPRGNR